MNNGSSTQMTMESDPTLEAWVEFCLPLTPTELILVIGYLSKNPDIRNPKLVLTGSLDSSSNWDTAGKWTKVHLRKFLKWYCGKANEELAEAAEQIAKTGAAAASGRYQA